jgi:hypothetical protein
MKSAAFVLWNILVKGLNTLVPGFNAKEREETGTWKSVLGVKANSRMCVKDRGFTVYSHFLTNSQKQTFLFSLYVWLF